MRLIKGIYIYSAATANRSHALYLSDSRELRCLEFGELTYRLISSTTYRLVYEIIAGVSGLVSESMVRSDLLIIANFLKT